MDSKRIEQIKKQFDDVIQTTEQGNVEYWYARDLMKLLGYTEWRNFEKAIGRAKESCETSGINFRYHFVEVNKMISIGKGGQREVREKNKKSR